MTQESVSYIIFILMSHESQVESPRDIRVKQPLYNLHVNLAWIYMRLT